MFIELLAAQTIISPFWDKWVSIGCILIGIAIGLSLAWYNINDEEGVQRRIDARRAQRKSRKNKWLPPKQ
jgi:hypothetical protein